MKTWTMILIVGVFACFLFGLSVTRTVAEAKQPEAEGQGRGVQDSSPPLTIAMSNVGNFSEGHSWYISVNAAGHASLSIDSVPNRTQRDFTVTSEQMQELRNALHDQRFFELGNEYGSRVPCGSTQSLAITAGGDTQTVKTYMVTGHDSKLTEACRVLRIAMLVRNWFSDADAVDLRTYDQRILDRCK